ncbi:MAG: single-stranded-DNA-specific exonuclease RecJ [Tepidanaerobacteraceae bacterium]|jgi:single-stranded-DNA-specific exonuclease|nr:single-stranded-DNA-specific exonuclease RecJ [Tepidanaerobacteraceae bacterium]
MMKSAIWKIISKEKEVDILNSPDLNPVILQLLKKRGIESSEQIERFLNPCIEYMHNPMLMKDMDKAVERIKKAINNHEKMTVYGDYDVDGITSTCIMVKTLKKLGGHVDYYIPSRLDEGYGLNMNSIEKLHNSGTKLIITVDNGISCFEEVDYAKKLGIDIIITDHHEPQDLIPHSFAVINPKQKSCIYPFKNLAGVGVVLKLAHALLDLKQHAVEEYLDLAALGTVADIVPLLDENRIIVKLGLEHLTKTSNKGLIAIKSLLNLSEIQLDTSKISFLLAPRLNAAGRISNAEMAVELLLTEDEDKAYELAQNLERVNRERQNIESEILNQARNMIEHEMDLDRTKVIVAASSKWHPGVIGIVASKLVEIYNRPCILIAQEGEEGKGSARSIPGFNIFEALSQVSHLLAKYGGHEQAAGLSIDVDKIEIFKKEINRIAEKTMTGNFFPELNIDMELSEENLTADLAMQLELLEPFGYGNPRPIFACENFYVKNIRTVGNDDKHLRLNLKTKQKELTAIGFNFGLYKEELNRAPIVDMAFFLELNQWQGITELQLKIKDIKIPYLMDELMINIEEGYYKRFYSDFKNRMICTASSEIFSDISNIDFVNNDTYFEKNEYVKKLFQQERNVLVLTNTPYQAWRLLAYFKNMEAIKNETGVFFSFEADVWEKKNVILINPVDLSCKKGADDIVFYDAPFSEKIFELRLKNMSCSSTIHVLFKNSDFRFNHIVCQKMLPDIGAIRKIYGLIKKLSFNKSKCIFSMNDFKLALSRSYDADIHDLGLVNVFNIFKEIGIVDFRMKNGFIQIKNHIGLNQSTSLEKSDTYREYFFIKQKLIEFEKMWREYNADGFKTKNKSN